jgi:hypothetical protein
VVTRTRATNKQSTTVTLTGGADVVQRGGLGGVAVGAGEVDGGDQRDLAAASQELQSTG